MLRLVCSGVHERKSAFGAVLQIRLTIKIKIARQGRCVNAILARTENQKRSYYCNSGLRIAQSGLIHWLSPLLRFVYLRPRVNAVQTATNKDDVPGSGTLRC